MTLKKMKCSACGIKESISFHSGSFGILCDDCYRGKSLPQRRTPLTAWQKKKLEFYRDESKWEYDIEHRKILPTGEVAILDNKGNIKEVRK